MFSIKEQEVRLSDGVAITFGSHGDGAHSCWARLGLPDRQPVTVFFQRDGEVMSVVDHPPSVADEGAGKMAESDSVG